MLSLAMIVVLGCDWVKLELYEDMGRPGLASLCQSAWSNKRFK